VLLHEGLGSVAHWRDWPARLAARTGCGVFAYSRHGYGGSEPLRERRAVGYMHHEAEIVLPDLLRQAGIARPILFGHSDGASIALLYAAAFPGEPRGLVLEAPHVFVEDVSVAGIAAARRVYETTDLRDRLARYHADPDGAFRGWNDIWLDPAFRAWNIEDRLAAIRCPLLLIQGEADEYGTRAQLDAIAARVPDTETALLPGGHAPHRDDPETVLALTADFVARITA
jgi:pimeloyl-ACP methyl ester carboxylesterase